MHGVAGVGLQEFFQAAETIFNAESVADFVEQRFVPLTENHFFHIGVLLVDGCE